MVADRVTVVSRPAGEPARRRPVGVRRPGRVHRRARREADARHRRHPAPEGGREGVPRRRGGCGRSSRSSPTSSSTPSSWTSRRRRTARRRRPRRRSTPARRSGCGSKTRGQAGGVQRVLQADLPRLPTTRPRSIHYAAEGQTEFKVLLFVPAHKPFELRLGASTNGGLQLYIQRVLIMDHCEAAAAAVPALRQGRGRFGRPAAERLARDCCSRTRCSRRSRRTSSRTSSNAGGDEERRSTTSTSTFFKELRRRS